MYSLYEKYSTYWYRLDPAVGPSCSGVGSRADPSRLRLFATEAQPRPALPHALLHREAFFQEIVICCRFQI